ncbi:hypothetical protein PPOP_0163, partial [Paenibacillus popilliae ATCC 14706]
PDQSTTTKMFGLEVRSRILCRGTVALGLTIRLALRLKHDVTTCVYFTDLKLVLWLDRLRATLYLCDKEQEGLIRTICMTEGLYLRK